jgi:4a-hydroxytetrahydrobiopterin dehydratase
MSDVLNGTEIRNALASIPEWKLNGNALERGYEFANFVQAMQFVNHVAEAAEAANHHPDIFISYNKVKLSLTSHDAGGVTRRDLRMAGKINELGGA